MSINIREYRRDYLRGYVDPIVSLRWINVTNDDKSTAEGSPSFSVLFFGENAVMHFVEM